MWTSRLAKNLEECRQAKHGRFKTPGCKGLKTCGHSLCVVLYKAVSRKIMVHSTRVHSLPPKKPTAGYTVLCILWYAIILLEAVGPCRAETALVSRDNKNKQLKML